MKTILIISVALFALINHGAAQGTAFTYQGRLNDGGSPANGLYDARFTVWDDPTNGDLVAGPLTNSATGVTNGLFTVTLDFGAGVFTGPALWLEVDVQTNGGGGFTTLLPLQPIQAVPYAVMANTASSLLGTLPATQLSGTIPLAQLPVAVVTNNATGLTLNGTLSGNASGLTSLNYNNIANPPLIPSTANLVATNDNRSLVLTNPANSFGGVFRGNGAGLSNLSTAALTNNQSGVVFSGLTTVSNLSVKATNSVNYLVVSNPPVLNGSAITNLNASQLSSGVIPLAQLPTGVITNNQSAVVFSGLTTVSNLAVKATNFVNYLVASNAPSLNGSAITNLNASNLSSGVIPLAQLPTVVMTNNPQTVTISGTNVVAPLTVLPTVPAAAIGSVGTGSNPYSVAVAGRYAYVVNYGADTLQIFDVSNPSAPVLVGSVFGDGKPYSVAVAGRYAYVANQAGNMLQIFDVSNPSAPISIGLVGTGASPFSVAVAGHYAYVVNASASTLQIFDVSTPSAAVLIGTVGTGSSPRSVAVAGRYAYVVNLYAYTMQVFDVSTPSAPVTVGSVSTGGGSMSVAVSGRYAYVANSFSSKLQIFDVSNPSAPVSVGAVETGSDPYSVAVAGRYAYVVNFDAKTLQIFDVSTPSAPVSVGSVGTGGESASVAVSGRYAYVVNVDASTLQVFDLGGAYIQQLEAGTMETGTLQTRDTMTVGNNVNVSGGLTVSGSALISGGLSLNNIVGGITTNIIIDGHTYYYTNGVLINIQ